MRSRALVLSALATAAGLVTALLTPVAATAAPPGTDFTGIVALSNCSASIVRYPGSQPTDKALALTNGHCYERGFLDPGQVVVNKKSNRAMTLLNPDAGNAGTVRADRVLYATMTKTDITLYELEDTYAELTAQFGTTPLTLATSGPADGTGIAVISGYWKTIYTCSVEETVFQLREASWTWDQSIQYHQPGCETIPGTSGSPVIDTATGQVVGANNTGYEGGTPCTFDNPCEVAPDGTTHVEPGAAYAQQTWWITTCVTAARTIDLDKAGCLLPKPAKRH
jgi:Trypsin-like peptidase domain